MIIRNFCDSLCPGLIICSKRVTAERSLFPVDEGLVRRLQLQPNLQIHLLLRAFLFDDDFIQNRRQKCRVYAIFEGQPRFQNGTDFLRFSSVDCRFLRISPHGGHPCLWLTVPATEPVVDFHHQVIAHAKRTKKASRKTACLSRGFRLPQAVPCSYWTLTCYGTLSSPEALYMVSVRQARVFPPSFFRFCLTTDTLDLGYILPTAGGSGTFTL